MWYLLALWVCVAGLGGWAVLSRDDLELAATFVAALICGLLHPPIVLLLLWFVEQLVREI